MSFTQKKIDVSIQLNDGTKFSGTSANIVTLTKLRVSATIVKAGGAGMSNAQIRIFGLSPSMMRQLSTYGVPPDFATQATIELTAGDDESGMSPVFVGNIQTAAADYSQMPEVVFAITAFTGLAHAIKPARPTSINGVADAAQIMSQLAATMGYTFENNKVSVKLSCPYFAGTARMQAQECAEAGDFNWIIDNDTLAIWPRNGSRSGDPVLFSPDTGMVGFPTFILKGVVVKALLNPQVKYGTKIKVQSSLQPAVGTWSVIHLLYELEAETPNGAWFMTMQALSLDFFVTSNAAPSN